MIDHDCSMFRQSPLPRLKAKSLDRAGHALAASTPRHTMETIYHPDGLIPASELSRLLAADVSNPALTH